MSTTRIEINKIIKQHIGHLYKCPEDSTELSNESFFDLIKKFTEYFETKNPLWDIELYPKMLGTRRTLIPIVFQDDTTCTQETKYARVILIALRTLSDSKQGLFTFENFEKLIAAPNPIPIANELSRLKKLDKLCKNTCNKILATPSFYTKSLDALTQANMATKEWKTWIEKFSNPTIAETIQLLYNNNILNHENLSRLIDIPIWSGNSQDIEREIEKTFKPINTIITIFNQSWKTKFTQPDFNFLLSKNHCRDHVQDKDITQSNMDETQVNETTTTSTNDTHKSAYEFKEEPTTEKNVFQQPTFFHVKHNQPTQHNYSQKRK